MSALPMSRPAPADPTLDLEMEIRRLMKERDAVVLAHYYQESEIQDLADFVGDSLELTRRGTQVSEQVIAFAGVHFMAETSKILTPEKTVVVPDLEAGCSLADGCPAPLLGEWLRKYPRHTVVSYINCSAGVKALSDVIVTSSSAEVILKQIPDPVVFAPDRNLAAWLEKKLNRKFVVWPGTCVVHETFSEKKLIDLMTRHPEAEVIAHPECEERILRHAAVVASTSGLLKHPPPLEGLVVLDLSRVLAGPLATMVLADLGARVIKVEDPRGGDFSRGWNPPALDGEAAYFLSVNRRKESAAVDLGTPAGAEFVRRWAARADVLVENFLPGALERRGLGV